ncbi:YraN family protein [Vreelandella massiliensis]|uniref:YraN family protein n=1 Tax=Vreelandella massiliensis TaxID=1816686 RepID=UPI00096A41A0|nr:YraN family protein [Halomonas massiliensis]
MSHNAQTARARGAAIEQRAAEWLQLRGLTLLGRNLCAKGGELDLVMQDGDTLVFVEVKHRMTTQFGHPLEAVTAKKQQRLVHAARVYLAKRQLCCPCRFDILAVVGSPPDLTFEWVQAAFDAF